MNVIMVYVTRHDTAWSCSARRYIPAAGTATPHRFLKRHRRELAGVPVAVFGMGPRTDTEDAWRRFRPPWSCSPMLVRTSTMTSGPGAGP